MAGVTFMVVYSRPTDIEAFEKVYQDEHVPKAVEKLGGGLASPQGIPPFTVSPLFTSR